MAFEKHFNYLFTNDRKEKANTYYVSSDKFRTQWVNTTGNTGVINQWRAKIALVSIYPRRSRGLPDRQFIPGIAGLRARLGRIAAVQGAQIGAM